MNDKLKNNMKIFLGGCNMKLKKWLIKSKYKKFDNERKNIK